MPPGRKEPLAEVLLGNLGHDGGRGGLGLDARESQMTQTCRSSGVGLESMRYMVASGLRRSCDGTSISHGLRELSYVERGGNQRYGNDRDHPEHPVGDEPAKQEVTRDLLRWVAPLEKRRRSDRAREVVLSHERAEAGNGTECEDSHADNYCQKHEAA